MGSERFLKKFIILLVFAGGLILFFGFGANQYLTLDTLKANRDKLVEHTEQNYWTMVMGAAVIYTAITALSLPLASGFSLMIGFLFGRWIGTTIILISATLGATLLFLGARYVFAGAAQRRLAKWAPRIMARFTQNDFNYLLFLRLIPLVPFWIVNLVAAFTPIKTTTYVIATAIGILPGCFVFTNLGQSLAQIESTEALLSLETLGAFVLLGIFALFPTFLKKILPHKEKEVF